MFARTPLPLSLAFAVFLVAPAYANVIQTFGGGSAVTNADLRVDFEDTAALGSSYTEGGITFNRVGLSVDNNGCGFAGTNCAAGTFANFDGNFFYGQSDGGYIEVLAPEDSVFTAIEFTHGFATADHEMLWQAFLGGASVGFDSFGPVDSGVIGFAGAAFDRFVFTSSDRDMPNLADSTNNPSLDLFSAEITVTATAAPSGGSLLLLAAALAGLAWARRC